MAVLVDRACAAAGIGRPDYMYHHQAARARTRRAVPGYQLAGVSAWSSRVCTEAIFMSRVIECAAGMSAL